MTNGSRTTVLLIRHGQTDAVGEWLAGRTEGVPLNQAGRAQAERLRSRLSSVNIAAIYSSPLQRAVETAGPLARERGLRIEPRLELSEVDFGEWNGERFERLATDARWTRFNTCRSMATVPRGERATDVQARVVHVLEDLRIAHPGGTIVCVSHADVIRLAVLYIAGAPVDFIHRFEIAPASVTGLALSEDFPALLHVNDRDPMTNGW